MLRFGGSALQLLRGLKVPSGASQNLTIHLILRSRFAAVAKDINFA
jgi:hypothetical protein